MVRNNIHPDFFVVQKLVCEPCGLICTDVEKEAESEEYGACTFHVSDHRAAFRVGKITPTKVGQFVTLWKRIGNGPIMPYDIADLIDVFVIMVRSNNRCGVFIFPKHLLHAQGVISLNGSGGKRAMRIYPAWDVADNPQAKKTQAWQLHYFFEINSHHAVDKERIKELLCSNSLPGSPC